MKLTPSLGGAPANVAVALARLGADVGFIGKVGQDDYGAFLIDLLAGEGVDVTHLVADSRGPTMLAIVAAPTPTEQQFVLYNGANNLLAVEDLPRPAIDTAQIFIYGSVTLASESRSAAVAAAQWARDAGRQVIFDVNLRPALWPNLEIAKQRIEQSVALASVVKLNDTELEFLTGQRDPAAGSQYLIDQGVQLCCVSLGANGSYFNNGKAQGHVPGFSVAVQDTTGSGDAFVAGLALQLGQWDQPLDALDGAMLYQMIAFANACGALAATQVGAMSAAPSMAAVEEMLGM